MKDSIERVIVSVFIVALAVSAVAAVAAVRNIRAAIDTSDWVNHTHALILEGDAILSSLHAGEAAFRNYLITGDGRDQGAYRVAFNEMVEHLTLAKALTRQEALQQEKFLQLEELLNQRINFTRELAQAAEEEGLDGARAQLNDGQGEVLLPEIRRLVAQLKDEHNSLLMERDKASYRQAQATRWTVFTGVTLNLLLLAFAGLMIRDDLAARRRAAVALQEANSQLEAKVQERTAELVESNHSLKKQNLEREWSNQALAHQLRYADLIIGGIKDLVLVVTRAQHISRVTPEVLHVTEFQSTDVIGSPVNTILELPEAAGKELDLHALLNRALKEGREIPETAARLRRKDGQKVAVRMNVVPMRDQDKVVGGVITARLVSMNSND